MFEVVVEEDSRDPVDEAVQSIHDWYEDGDVSSHSQAMFYVESFMPKFSDEEMRLISDKVTRFLPVS